MRGHTGEGMEGTEDEWGSRNNWLEISRRGRMEKFGFWEKIRDLEARIWAFFFYFRQSGANAARSGFDIGRRTNEVEYRSIRNWICHGLCVPGFLERPPTIDGAGNPPSPPIHSRPVELRNRWMGHVETIRASRARKRWGGKNKRGSLSLSFVSIYFNAEISKIFARVLFSFFFPRNIRNVFAEKGFPKIKFKLSSETSYFLRKIARKSYSSMRGGFLTGIMS